MPRTPPACYDYAVYLLSRRGHAVVELTGKLKQKKYAPQEVEETISRLKEQGFLNDEKFAAARVYARAVNSKWGMRRIEGELRALGVAADVVEKAVEQFETEDVRQEDPKEFWEESAEQVLLKKFGVFPEDLQQPPALPEAKADWFKKREKEQRRRLDFLLRRGFSMKEARLALEASKCPIDEMAE